MRIYFYYYRSFDTPSLSFYVPSFFLVAFLHFLRWCGFFFSLVRLIRDFISRVVEIR